MLTAKDMDKVGWKKESEREIPQGPVWESELRLSLWVVCLG